MHAASTTSIPSMQMKHDSTSLSDSIFTTSPCYTSPKVTGCREPKTGGDLLAFLKSATLNSVKMETCEKPEKRRKRVVHPSKHILRNMNEEGLDCGAYAKRRVGRKPRPNVIPDEVMKSEDYFDPLVEALFTDASKVDRLPEEAFRTPEKGGMRTFQNPPRLRGRPPKRKTVEIPIEQLVSLHANFNYNYNFNNNNNNNNNNTHYTITNSQQCFSDPALANILQDELQFLPTTIEELYSNTVQTNYYSTPCNMSLSNLTLQTPASPKKFRPATERPTHRSCRRKLDLSMEAAFTPNSPLSILPEDFLIPPPSKRARGDSPVPPLPSINSISYPYLATDLIPSPVDPAPLDSWIVGYQPQSAPYAYYSNSSTVSEPAYTNWSDVSQTPTSFSATTVEAPYDLELDQMLDLLGRDQSQTFFANGILVE